MRSILANGKPQDLLTDPSLPFMQLDQAASLLDARVVSHDDNYHLTTVAVAGGNLVTARSALAQGSATRVCIYARDVSLSRVKPEHTSIQNCLCVEVADVIADHHPARVIVKLQLADADLPAFLLSRITRLSADRLKLVKGMRVYAQIKAVALMT